jgi:hypothetical protein
MEYCKKRDSGQQHKVRLFAKRVRKKAGDPFSALARNRISGSGVPLSRRRTTAAASQHVQAPPIKHTASARHDLVCLVSGDKTINAPRVHIHPPANCGSVRPKRHGKVKQSNKIKRATYLHNCPHMSRHRVHEWGVAVNSLDGHVAALRPRPWGPMVENKTKKVLVVEIKAIGMNCVTLSIDKEERRSPHSGQVHRLTD